MTIQDTIKEVGTSIINLTRAKANVGLDNITEKGKQAIRDIVAGTPKVANSAAPVLTDESRGKIMGWESPDYSKGTNVTTSNFTCLKEGVISGYVVSVTNTLGELFINNVLVGGANGTSSIQVRVGKGDILTYTNLDISKSKLFFFPLKGTNNLI